MIMSEQIEKLATGVVQSLDLELFRFEDVQQSSRRVIRLYIYKTDGVSVDDCSEVSRAMDTMMEVENLLTDESYTLEVSSLGIDRPLIAKREFEVNLNQMITIQYMDESQKKQKKTAKLIQIVDEIFHFKNKQEVFSIDYQQIVKGIVEVSF